MPTIKDVAREAGVSIATVSYVLNNKTESISDDTCRQVIAAAERIGYAPNITARNLRYSRTNLIGYAWHDLPDDQVNPVLDRFAYYLARTAENAGYHLLTFTTPAQDPISVYNELIRTGRVDGFVLAGTQVNDPRIPFLLESRFPFVGFGRSNPEWNFPWVDIDGEAGVRQSVEHLIDLGHRQIAMIAWLESDTVSYFRVRGYQEALSRAGLPLRADYVIRGQHGEQLGRDAIDYWWQLPASERPTAIVAASDTEAISAMRAAERRGMEIGKTLSIIGFDDLPLSQYLRPSLTTINQPIPLIAEKLIMMLEGLLNHKDLPERRVLITPQLVLRESSGSLLS